MSVAIPTFEPLFAHAVQLMSEANAPGAEIAFRDALLLAPQLMEAHVNLGLLLCQRAAWSEAEHHYRIAIALAPERIEALLHLGAMLTARKRFAEAENVYRQALLIEAHSPEALSNLGVLLACLKREPEAEECYRTALSLAPASFNLASLLLRQGRFEEGWAAFEARDTYARLEEYFSFPRWRGEALKGKTLLIGFEAGHGDMIQFCRYVSMAKARGAARIALVCHPALKALFTRLVDADEVFGFDEQVPSVGWDYWTPPLLQKGAGEDEAGRPGQLPEIADLSSCIGNFDDTAAIIMNLDLVISVDTAVGHLAGALGKPCWMLLPHFKTDWRWLTERDESPWYPGTMRLFRQSDAGAWTSVIAAVRAALQELIATGAHARH